MSSSKRKRPELSTPSVILSRILETAGIDELRSVSSRSCGFATGAVVENGEAYTVTITVNRAVTVIR